ncbi:hypothetical protein DNTS_033281 [Danionella cerebrum]|uniref:G-protein coupled receptors family 1 profile domain-containing protein n=1 Tax=Danionella cerebrum TaxID=2873325 RepID=A0A553R2K4_9TELE|nr:hypothetical protein DNTS_033281 [Danionella translucida]
MSATEEDTELRDLLIQNLENNGVLNKIKAELRAAVFLALEEQDKVENKTPLVNDNLKKSLNTKDGRLVAGLITDFLQVFNLDFTLAVFQPEISTLNGLETRETLSKELDISESEVNKNTPLLLELVKRGRHKDKGDRVTLPKELLPFQIAEARMKFDSLDKTKSGAINREAVVAIFTDLFPQFSSVEVWSPVTLAKHLIPQVNLLKIESICLAAVRQANSPSEFIPRYKGFVKHSSAQEVKADLKDGDRRPDEALVKNRGSVKVSEGIDDGKSPQSPMSRALELGLDDDDDEEGDSFFDDPLPKPQKSYGGGLSSTDKLFSAQRLSEKNYTQKDLSTIGSDGEELFSDCECRPSPKPQPRREDLENSLAKAFSGNTQLKSSGGSISADSNQKDLFPDKNDEDLDYDDDFNSHRSENSKSEVSVEEEIEEVSIEGPDISDKLDEVTQDVSVSQSSFDVDYMEDCLLRRSGQIAVSYHRAPALESLLITKQTESEVTNFTLHSTELVCVDTEKMSTNDTEYFYEDIEELCSMERAKTLEYILQLFIHPIICLAGFIGNTLVIVTYALYKRTKSMTDVYLLNVAIADILFVLALPLIIYSEQHGWSLGNTSCKLLRGIYSVNLFSGVLLLACISGDRYLAIVKARRSFRLRSSTLLYSHLVCATVWLLALLLSLPTFIYYERYLPDPIQSTVLQDNITEDMQHVCFFMFELNTTARAMKTIVPSSQVAVGFFLPLVIMGFCYCSVIVTLLRAKNFQRHKAVRVVLTVVFVFVVCHMPYNVTLLYYTIYMFEQQQCSHDEAVHVTLAITKSLAYLHSCLNPLLYAFIGVNFRNHFQKILRDLWCLGKNCMSARWSLRVSNDLYQSSRRSTDFSNNENVTSFTM